jgi:hypothetical protein
MALSANAVPAGRLEFGRVHDPMRPLAISRGHQGNMLFARAVASLATDTILQKWRIGETILRACDRLKPAGMTLQATGLDSSRQIDRRITPVAGRNIPFRGSRIVGNRRLEQEPVKGRSVAAANSAGSNEPSKNPLASRARIVSRKLEAVSVGRRRDTIPNAQTLVPEIGAIEILAEFPRARSTATPRHTGSRVLAVDLGVAASAHFTPHFLPRRRYRAQHHESLESGDHHNRTQYIRAPYALTRHGEFVLRTGNLGLLERLGGIDDSSEGSAR